MNLIQAELAEIELAPFAEVVCLHLPVESSIFDHGVTQSEIWYDCNETTNDICPYDR